MTPVNDSLFQSDWILDLSFIKYFLNDNGGNEVITHKYVLVNTYVYLRVFPCKVKLFKNDSKYPNYCW